MIVDDNITEILFSKNIELLDSVTEFFELQLAYLEFVNLSKNDFLNRTAYFKSANGKLSNHYYLCAEQSEFNIKDRTPISKSYFENGQFSTGYATHGLFPYRGKFHPQLIKGLINIIGLKEGDVLLDPMCGSGTANIEAAMLGIDSFAIDISPFCQFMTEVKFEALTIESETLNSMKGKAKKFFEFFGNPTNTKKLEELEESKRKGYKLALLAYLDALGYSMRVVKSNHSQLFVRVFDRYINTIEKLINNKHYKRNIIGNVKVLKNSEALNIELEDNTIDAVITSPPYSFAIDYAENDRPQLEFLGYDVNGIKSKMIGLKGKTKQDKLNNYFEDMNNICLEIARVLKNGKFFVMIIGSNTNQTGGIRLEKSIIDSAQNSGMKLKKSLLKPIKGMRNIMKEEYILFFQKT